MITQQQALEALESVYGAVFRAHGSQAYKVLRQYIEQSAAGDVVMVYPGESVGVPVTRDMFEGAAKQLKQGGAS